MLLSVDGLYAGYSSVPVLRDVSLQVAQGSVVAVLGPNGAGKTTLLRAISGLLPPAAGTVTFDGRDVTSLMPHEMVVAGMAHCPEGRRMFPYMSTEENLRIGAYTRRDRRQVEEAIDDYLERWPVIGRRRHAAAGQLSGGEQQLVALGRAMMSDPRLLLLDEPSLGLAPVAVDQLYAAVRELARGSRSILLVEQNARHALSLADVACVLVAGEIVHVGPADDITADDVADLYFRRRTEAVR